jgi:hypothetical protein
MSCISSIFCRCFLSILGIGLAAGTAGAHPPQAPVSQPAQPSQVPSSQAPAAKPPIFNRANEVLPSWLRVRGEFRGRLEGFEGAGFTAGRDDLYWLNRFRLNATVTASPLLSFQVQAQDARVARKQIGPTGAPFKALFDLRTAFADIGHAKTPVAVRIGRQELAFGEQRLVGHVSWLNAARTFDGAKVTLRGRGVVVDAFGASVVRILDGRVDRSGNGNRFLGAYAVASTLVPQGTVEPYVFWRADRNLRTELNAPGDLQVATVGVRLAGKLPSAFEYGIETAFQTGSLGSDSVGAWAGHYQVRTPAGPRGFRLTTEYNYASGDSDPTDGERGTFDQLYPTPHDKYGLADQVGWRNIRHARVGVELTPAKGWPVSSNYHSWWLAETRDGLYAAGSGLVARIASGAASSHVGQELDVQLTRALTPQIQIAAGYAHIFPGGFLKQATPGASYSLPYAMVTYVFLAER